MTKTEMADLLAWAGKSHKSLMRLTKRQLELMLEIRTAPTNEHRLAAKKELAKIGA